MKVLADIRPARAEGSPLKFPILNPESKAKTQILIGKKSGPDFDREKRKTPHDQCFRWKPIERNRVRVSTGTGSMGPCEFDQCFRWKPIE